MKRSRNVELTAVMLATAVVLGACDNTDDRTVKSNEYRQTTQSFNYEAEKKLRVTCNKPEDFNESDCHKPQGSAVAASSSPTHSHSFMPIFMPYHYPGYYGSAGYSGYGPSTRSARSFSSARSAVVSPGLSGMYRASSVPSSAFRGASPGMSSTIAARSMTAGIARGGFGGTGRAISAVSMGSTSAAT
jgi:hypothetical protein